MLLLIMPNCYRSTSLLTMVVIMPIKPMIIYSFWRFPLNDTLVFDRLIGRGPEVLDKMRWGRSRHPNLGEQNSNKLFIWISVS